MSSALEEAVLDAYGSRGQIRYADEYALSKFIEHIVVNMIDIEWPPTEIDERNVLKDDWLPPGMIMVVDQCGRMYKWVAY